MPRGGKRAGSGRPKGSKEAHTLAKDIAREAFRKRITDALEPLADSLLSRAKGVRYFVTRNKKTGKYELVTDPEHVVAALNGEDDYTGEFYTDKPDTAAIKEALDRALDKSKEQEQEVHHSGGLVITWQE